MSARSHQHPPLHPALRATLVAEFRERWARAGYPSLVQHILGNMSEAHGVPLAALKDIARGVRAEYQHSPHVSHATASDPPTSQTSLAVVDGSNLAWARTTDDGHPRLDNLRLVRTALAERGYQALVVVDAALRHQLGQRDAGELERHFAAQVIVQAPAETDGDLWVIRIAEHHAAPIVSNDRFDEYRQAFPWLAARRVAVVLTGDAALLQGDALDGSGQLPESPAALREEIERLRQSAEAAHARTEDVVALRGRVAHLEGSLAREQARSAEAQAEADRLNKDLSEERRLTDSLRQELRQHPEQLARLSTQLADAQTDAATARGQRDAVQDRVRDLERQLQKLSTRRPEERGAAATRADLDALTSQLRGEIRDLARGLKDVQSPLPRILAMTREVREAVTGIQASQGHTTEALQRLEQASESLSDTADYLVALAEEDHDATFDDEDLVDDDELDEDEDRDEEFETADDAEDVEDDDHIESGSNANDRALRAASDASNLDSEEWQSEFERIEAAWMAGRRVGDPHEAINFLHLLSDLRLDDRAPSEVLASFDRFRARAGGDSFSYCPLHGAVHLVHVKKPSLDNGLVLVRYRELARLPPCKSIEDCPGIAASVSEVLGRSWAAQLADQLQMSLGLGHEEAEELLWLALDELGNAQLLDMAPAITAAPSRRRVLRTLAVAGLSAMLLPAVAPVAAEAASVQDVVPILECVIKQPSGVFTARFGYSNPNSKARSIPIGARNRFTPEPNDCGQRQLASVRAAECYTAGCHSTGCYPATGVELNVPPV